MRSIAVLLNFLGFFLGSFGKAYPTLILSTNLIESATYPVEPRTGREPRNISESQEPETSIFPELQLPDLQNVSTYDSQSSKPFSEGSNAQNVVYYFALFLGVPFLITLAVPISSLIRRRIANRGPTPSRASELLQSPPSPSRMTNVQIPGSERTTSHYPITSTSPATSMPLPEGVQTSFKMEIQNAANPCGICLEPFGIADVAAVQCMHVFHTACLEAWMEKEISRKLCPLCRHAIHRTA